MKISIIVVFLIFLTRTFTLNILGVFPHIGKSHVDVFVALIKGLAHKGHTVTVISHFPLSKPIPNYKDIDLGGMSYVMERLFAMNELEPGSRLQMIDNAFLLSHLANMSCEVGMSSPTFQKFLTTDEKFDLLITEFFNSDCFFGTGTQG